MNPSQITDWCHQIIRSVAKKDGLYIDATMGKGHDTKLLCELAGEQGSVLAFDIQSEAVHATENLLQKEGLLDRATLLLTGHEHMDEYVQTESVDVVCFNFGYLPGGNHSISTKQRQVWKQLKKGLPC